MLFLYFHKRKLFLYSQKSNPAVFSPSSKKNPLGENFSYFRKQKPRKICYIFSKEIFPYISGNGNHEKFVYTPGNPEKILCISENGTFLYFGKGIFRTLPYSEPWYIQNTRHIRNTVKYL